ncbi:hypothetical protein BCR42DRAFT_442782 [Absidia repens]|uniref:Uncharacterized protein n=1 Tax=Absidia repens TaxID=90262 RepID=A0A1X2I3A9_9FUNG|nr:hypothetical protein BCR42DRAFT_442782 [Absidia repens]
MLTALKTINQTSPALLRIKFQSVGGRTKHNGVLAYRPSLNFVNEDSRRIKVSVYGSRLGYITVMQQQSLADKEKASAAKLYVARQLMDEPSDINLIKGLQMMEQLLILPSSVMHV